MSLCTANGRKIASVRASFPDREHIVICLRSLARLTVYFASNLYVMAIMVAERSYLWTISAWEEMYHERPGFQGTIVRKIHAIAS